MYGFDWGRDTSWLGAQIYCCPSCTTEGFLSQPANLLLYISFYLFFTFFTQQPLVRIQAHLFQSFLLNHSSVPHSTACITCSFGNWHACAWQTKGSHLSALAQSCRNVTGNSILWTQQNKTTRFQCCPASNDVLNKKKMTNG